LPGRLASFESPTFGHLTHEVNRANVVHLDLKDSFDGGSDLWLGSATVNTKGQQLLSVLRLFLCHQCFLSNHRRLDDVPNSSHFLSRLLLLWFPRSFRLGSGFALGACWFGLSLSSTRTQQLIELLGSRARKDQTLVIKQVVNIQSKAVDY